MALKSLLKKIKADASAEIASIKETAKKQIQKREAEVDVELTVYSDEISKRTRSEIEQLKKRAQINAVLNDKAATLATMRNRMDAILNAVKHHYAKKSGKEYESFVTKLLHNVPAKFEKDATMIPVKHKENETKSALRSSGSKFELGDSSTAITAGILLHGKKEELDLSIEEIIKNVRSDIDVEIISKMQS